MESSMGRNRSGAPRALRAAVFASAIVAGAASGALATGGGGGSPDAFVRSDEAERLVLALESAQAELEHAALARERVAEARAANNPVRVVRAWLAAAASNTPLLAGAGVAGGVLIGMALVTGFRGVTAKPRRAAPARKAAARPSARIDAEPAPRADSVVLTPAASRAREGESENVWAKILRLSSAGMSGEEISRMLGASADDIDLVLGLQRRRMEIAGALGQSGAGRVKAASR